MSTSIELILNDNIKNLGEAGQTIKVKGGYARNYLIPRGLAMPATKGNLKIVAAKIKLMEKERARLLAEAKKVAKKIEGISVTVQKPVGQEDKIFGSVTHAELADLLSAEGLEIDKKTIQVNEEISKTGVYTGHVKLHQEVSAAFKIWVVAQ